MDTKILIATTVLFIGFHRLIVKNVLIIFYFSIKEK